MTGEEKVDRYFEGVTAYIFLPWKGVILPSRWMKGISEVKLMAIMLITLRGRIEQSVEIQCTSANSPSLL